MVEVLEGLEELEMLEALEVWTEGGCCWPAPRARGCSCIALKDYCHFLRWHVVTDLQQQLMHGKELTQPEGNLPWKCCHFDIQFYPK